MDEWLSKVGDKFHSLRNELKNFVSETSGHSESQKVFWLLQVLDCVVVLTKQGSPLETRTAHFSECVGLAMIDGSYDGREVVARRITDAHRNAGLVEKNAAVRHFTKGRPRNMDNVALGTFVKSFMPVPDRYVREMNKNLVSKKELSSFEAVFGVKEKRSKAVGFDIPLRLFVMLGKEGISSYEIFGRNKR